MSRPDDMGDEFALEHWKSRALVAEKECDSARSVLAGLRGYIRRYDANSASFFDFEKLRNKQRAHDQVYWTQEHAINAVTEFIDGTSEIDELPKGPTDDH